MVDLLAVKKMGRKSPKHVVASFLAGRKGTQKITYNTETAAPLGFQTPDSSRQEMLLSHLRQPSPSPFLQAGNAPLPSKAALPLPFSAGLAC